MAQKRHIILLLIFAFTLLDSSIGMAQGMANLKLQRIDSVKYYRDSTVLHFSLCNNGTVPMAPFPTSVYTNNDQYTPIETIMVPDTIFPNSCQNRTLTIDAATLCGIVADTLVLIVNNNDYGTAQLADLEPENNLNDNCARTHYLMPRLYHQSQRHSIVQGNYVKVGNEYFYTTIDTNITLTASDGCDSIVHLSLEISALSVGNDCPTTIVGADTVVYLSHPRTYTLSTATDATYYRWQSDGEISDSSSATQQFTISPGEERTFVVLAMYEDTNELIFNGDFELGNIGFESQYRWLTTREEYNWHNWGIYTMSYTPFGSSWTNCRSSNSTTYFISDASEYPNVRVYQTKVRVSPHTLYAFRARFTNVYTTQGIELQFFADEAPLGPPQLMYGSTCVWNTLYELVNSGERTEMTFYFIDNSYYYTNGNDIAIDDVSLRGLCASYDTFHIRAIPCTQYDTIVAATCDEPYLLGDHAITASGIYDTLLYDQRGCDSLVHLILTINPTNSGDTLATVCDSIVWHNTTYFADTTVQQEYLNQYQCDSTVTLHLTVNYSAPADTTATVCNRLTWRNHTYMRDTHFVHPYRTIHGCDSTQSLTLTVHYDTALESVDTFCQGSKYLFVDELFDSTGTYIKHLTDKNGCDSVVTLHLTERPLMPPTITYSFDCRQRLYTLHGYTSMPVSYWLSEPHDLQMGGREHDSVVVASPYHGTLYRYYAAYATQPQCPAFAEIILAQPSIPHASMILRPSYLSADQPELTAYDHSNFDGNRLWIVNGQEMGYGGDILNYRPPVGYDSIRVTLKIYNDLCRDSVTMAIPYRHISIFMPNTFTPELPSNNRFGAYATGLTHFQMTIFDRRGHEIYHTTTLSDQWDGTYHGTPCPQDTYTYIVKYRDLITPGNWQHLTGTVLLIR